MPALHSRPAVRPAPAQAATGQPTQVRTRYWKDFTNGANGQDFYGGFTAGTPCGNSVFGDPAIGTTTEACHVQ